MNEDLTESSRGIDQAQIERDLEAVKRLANLPWQRELHNVEALIERLRIEMIVNDHRGSRKQFQRAVIDRLEDVLEERYDKEDADRARTRRSIMTYVRDLWESLET